MERQPPIGFGQYIRPPAQPPPQRYQIKLRAASSLDHSLGQPQQRCSGWPRPYRHFASRTGFEDAVVSKEAQDDVLAAALWLRSAELVGLPA